MDYLLNSLQYMELDIPLWQVGIFIVLITIFTFFARLRLCLLTTYVFTLFWVFILNSEKFGQTYHQKIFFVSSFFVCAFITVVLVMWSFYKDPGE